MEAIAPSDFYREWQENNSLRLIDVRSSDEFRNVHAQMAELYPLPDLKGETATDLARADQLFFICKSGTRAREAARILENAGLSTARVIEGGTDAWVREGLPSTKAKRQVIPIMRQVQIVVGVLILLGVALHFLLHPLFVLLPAFVGAGLLFAGITGTCGMAIMLSWMPWNKP